MRCARARGVQYLSMDRRNAAGFTMAMQCNEPPDRALVDHRRRRRESNCPTPLTLGVEIGPLLRKVASGHRSIVRWSSWLVGRDIHVSPMSGAWLRRHEVDCNKHAADV